MRNLLLGWASNYTKKQTVFQNAKYAASFLVLGFVLSEIFVIHTIGPLWNDMFQFSPVEESKVLNNKEISQIHVNTHLSIENFGWRPWEASSLLNGTCNPPDGVPESCCIGGTHSTPYDESSSCLNVPQEAYDRTKDLAMNFLMQHPVKGNNCDICQIIDTLMEQNLNLAFQGDSVMLQAVNGLECELSRQGYNVSTTDTVIRELGEIAETAISPYLDWNISSNWKYGLIKVYNITVTRANEPLGDKAKISLFHMYRPFQDNHEIDHIAKNNDIVVFDHSLHWYPFDMYEYQFSMAQMLRGYKETMKDGKHKKKLLAWRETTAQHFPTPTGDYIGGESGFPQCFPIDEELVPDRPFRTTLMHRAADMAGFRVVNALNPHTKQDENHSENDRELVMLPFYGFSRENFKLHGEDCTHYCHTPHMWLSIWRSLRLSIDRVFL